MPATVHGAEDRTFCDPPSQQPLFERLDRTPSRSPVWNTDFPAFAFLVSL